MRIKSTLNKSLKIIVINEYYGSGASGTIVHSFINCFSQEKIHVEIISVDPFLKSNSIYEVPYYFDIKLSKYFSKQWFSRLDKFVTIVFKSSLDLIFFNKKKFKNDLKSKTIIKPDLIIQFVSGRSIFSSFVLAKEFVSNYNIPYFIHFFDPKPGLLDWDENKYLLKSSKKYLYTYVNSATIISAISDKMLNILKSYYNLNSDNMRLFSIPIKDNLDTSIYTIVNREIKILYLGSIYGKRDINPFIKAVSILINHGYNIIVTFAGSSLDLKNVFSIFPNLIGKINLILWSDNVDNLINQHDVLLDLNSNNDNDPFISSKLFSYLGYSKPILSICSQTSASYAFASKFQSTYLTNNVSENIITILIFIFEQTHFFDLRKKQIMDFDIQKLLREYILLN